MSTTVPGRYCANDGLDGAARGVEQPNSGRPAVQRLNGGHNHAGRLDREQRLAGRRRPLRGCYDKRLARLDAEPLGRTGVVGTVRADGVTERGRALLVGLVVGPPVVVHYHGIESLRRLQLRQPVFGIGQRADLVDRDRAHQDHRRVERGPGYAAFRVGDVHPASHGEPVLAGTGDLVDFRAHHRPGDVHAHHAVGHVEGKAQVNALLLAHRFLVDHVDEIDAV